jgi:hypothetical protein
LIYYCEMREHLKNIFANQITLEDGSEYFYTVKPYELTNAIGNIIAVLQEYNFAKKDDNNGEFPCKLYKTKEGNWYDITEANSSAYYNILRCLKIAIDVQGNTLNKLIFSVNIKDA